MWILRRVHSPPCGFFAMCILYQCFCFQTWNYYFFGCFDPENMSLDNTKKYHHFAGWANRYIDYKRSTVLYRVHSLPVVSVGFLFYYFLFRACRPEHHGVGLFTILLSFAHPNQRTMATDVLQTPACPMNHPLNRESPRSWITRLIEIANSTHCRDSDQWFCSQNQMQYFWDTFTETILCLYYK